MKLLSIDYGDARTGLAVCDETGFLATAIDHIAEADPEALADKIAALCSERQIEGIILGYPKNMNDTLGPRAQKTQEFAALLEARGAPPITLWDERCTTVLAHTYMNATNTRGKKRKKNVDSLSAQILLQDYLDSRRGTV